MLKIRRFEDQGVVIFALSGHIEEEDLSQLKKLIAEETATEKALDLDEVKIVNRQVVGFLVACEAQGMGLRNCPVYVRQWMGTRRNSHGTQL
jgi:hypothetical protein